jgi:ATP-dependent Clp protease, protease subunit
MFREDEPEKPEAEAESKPAAISDSLRERLFKARTLIISGEVNQQLAAQVISQLLAMDAESNKGIVIYINSQGGHVESGDTIHDMIRYVRSPVKMVGTGWVASAGALIYVAAPRDQRYCLPNTRFLLHQPAGGVGGQAADIEIEAREIISMRERLNRVFARETGQPLEKIEEDTRRNFWLSAQAAQQYGLVGKIIQNVEEIS